jgi:DNA-directed RNA polymerase specialized sigma24 family protein
LSETGRKARRLARFLQPIRTNCASRSTLKPTKSAQNIRRKATETVVDKQLALTSLFGIYVMTLSETERKILQLLDIDRLDYQTVGEHLSLTATKVAKTAFEARRKLHERMGPSLDEIA